MQLLETKQPILPTIPLRAAGIFAADLAVRGGAFNIELSERIQSQIVVAELSGRRRIDFGQAVREVEQANAVEESSEVAASIDSMINQVIDLR